MIPLFIWILCPADIVYLIKIDILGSRIKVMKKWCLRIFIWRYKGICLLYSPHMWRWSYSLLELLSFIPVFSTHVEVIPMPKAINEMPIRILHTCGGDPFADGDWKVRQRYSPHMWRWSLMTKNYWFPFVVFSTHVEVILF